MEEIWKDIKDFEGLYQVSNLGRVKSLKRVVVRNNNRPLLVEEKILKPHILKKGKYLRISLRNNGIRKMYLVHRLVSEAFIPNPNNYQQVNHKDENTLNNCVSNLEYCDVLYNNNYGTRNKRISEKHKGVLFSEEHKKKLSKALTNRSDKSKPVLQIDKNTNEVIAVFPSAAEAGRQLGFKTNGHISECCKGKYKQAYGYIWRYKDESAA